MSWTVVEDRQKYSRYERGDGAVVMYDWNTAFNTSKPWLKAHRGWIAFGPGTDEHNYLRYINKHGLGIPLKYKTAQAAMAAVDKAFPKKEKG